MNRRKFLGTIATVGSAAIVGRMLFSGGVQGGKSSSSSKEMGISNRRWGILIDLRKCNGCKACTVACNLAHNVPKGQEWIKCYEVKDTPVSGPYYFVRPCMSCQDAPCVKVCPVGATFYNEDGIVLINNKTCIGCRFCMAACPYGARYFNWEEPEQPETPPEDGNPEYANTHLKGTVEKCDFCAHIAKEGRLPACIGGCPTGAIYYGDYSENAVSNGRETIPFIETLETQHGYRYKEELGTEPRVYYLPPRHD